MLAVHELAGGFADPVFDSQTVFRAVLEAFAHPGEVRPVPTCTQPPAQLTGTAAAVLLSLADADTPVFLDAPVAAAPSVAAWIRFHCGAPITNRSEKAAFVVISHPEAMGSLDAFAQGTAEYPDRSATLILQVGSLEDSGGGLELSGPGIAGSQMIFAVGLPAAFAEMWSANQALFPLGVDIILAAPAALAALPRTVAILGPIGAEKGVEA